MYPSGLLKCHSVTTQTLCLSLGYVAVSLSFMITTITTAVTVIWLTFMEANINSLGTVPKIRWALSPCNKQFHKEESIRAPISQMRMWRHTEVVWLVQGPTVHLCTCTWSLCSLAPPVWFIHSVCQARQILSMFLSCFLFNIISTASLKETIWGFLYCVCRSGLILPCFLLFWGFGAILKYLA